MEIVQIISEWKKVKVNRIAWPRQERPKAGMKRVMAIVRVDGELMTRHIDVKA